MVALKLWGNSAALRIPAPILEQAGMAVDQPLTLRAEKGRIIVECAQPSYDIDELVAAINPDNLPTVAAHSRTVGAEEIEW